MIYIYMQQHKNNHYFPGLKTFNKNIKTQIYNIDGN